MRNNTAVRYIQPPSIKNGYQALGETLLNLGSISDDQERRKQQEQQNELTGLQLDNERNKQTQKAIDDTYMKYVDSRTGKFNQEALDKDNVGLPLNQVSQEAKQKQYTIEQGYNAKLDELDKLAQTTINQEVLKEASKYDSKEEFEKNVNSDLIKYADGKTMFTIDKAYGSNQAEKNKLANDKAKLELDKKLVEIDKKQNKGPREVKAADSNSIKSSVASLFGGTYDPLTGELKGLDPDASVTAMNLAARTAEIYKENNNITHNEAVAKAYNEYKKEQEKPKSKEKKKEYGLKGSDGLDIFKSMNIN